MIKWGATKADTKLIKEIVKRAIAHDPTYPKMDCWMDIEATHLNGCKLDLKKLLAFDDFNFWHDIAGISNHIDRTTGKLTRCFLPRCARGGK